MRDQFDPEQMAVMRNSALPPEVDRLSSEIIGAAIEIHSHLGPGLREKMYENALVAELRRRDVVVAQQVPFHVYYKGTDLGVQVVDVVVASRVVVECKSTAAVVERDGSQLTGYLRFTNLPLGLLINFNVARVKDGITRKVNWPLRLPSDAVAISSNSSFESSVLPS